MKKKYIIDRIMALCYDYIFVLLLVTLISFGLDYLNQKYFHMQHFVYLIIVVNVLVYVIVFPLISLKLNGSIGKSLNDLYVNPTNGKMTYGRVLFREILMTQILYLTIIGFVCDIIFFITKKETLHDYYLKTTVYKKEKPVKENTKKHKLFFKSK